MITSLLLLALVFFIICSYQLISRKEVLEIFCRNGDDSNYVRVPDHNRVNPRFLYSFLPRKLLLPVLRSPLMSYFAEKILYRRRWSRFLIRRLVKQYSIDLKQFRSVSGRCPSLDQYGYKNFADFFIRHLSPEELAQRYFLSQDLSDSAIVSPADSRLLIFENLPEDGLVPIKGVNVGVADLLKDTDVAQTFAGGTLLIFRLAPGDYHRFHFPMHGFAGEVKNIKGALDSVHPVAYRRGGRPLLNKRDVVSLYDQNNDFIASMVIVGAMGVGRMHYTYEPMTQVRRTDECGFFDLGGSTVVLIFPKDKLEILPNFVANSRTRTKFLGWGVETMVKMGEPIGFLKN